MPLPDCLRVYLQTLGLFEDLTTTEDNPILVFDTVSEYAAARQDLLDGMFGEIDMKLLPFGQNGTGDLFALLSRTDGNADIFFLRQDVPTAEATGLTFDGWLEGVAAQALAGMNQRTPNADKVWCVQFSFKGADFDAIVETLRQVGKVALPRGWEHIETSQTGVRKATARLALDGQSITVRRLEYPHWIAPWYFIDMAEPLDTGGKSSTIQNLDDLFHDSVPGYGMINFGALARSGI